MAWQGGGRAGLGGLCDLNSQYIPRGILQLNNVKGGFQEEEIFAVSCE